MTFQSLEPHKAESDWIESNANHQHLNDEEDHGMQIAIRSEGTLTQLCWSTLLQEQKQERKKDVGSI